MIVEGHGALAEMEAAEAVQVQFLLTSRIEEHHKEEQYGQTRRRVDHLSSGSEYTTLRSYTVHAINQFPLSGKSDRITKPEITTACGTEQ